MHTRYLIKYIHFRQITCCLVRRLVDSSSRFARVRINFDLISKSHTKKPKTLFRLVRTLQRKSKQFFFWAKTFLEILQKNQKNCLGWSGPFCESQTVFYFLEILPKKTKTTFQVGLDPLAKVKRFSIRTKLFRLVRTLQRKSKQNFLLG